MEELASINEAILPMIIGVVMLIIGIFLAGEPESRKSIIPFLVFLIAIHFLGSAGFIIINKAQYKKNEEIEKEIEKEIDKKIEEKLQNDIFKSNIYDATKN